MHSGRFFRTFWFCVGVLALLFGGIGVVLPVLPTTPFVILAAFAFGRSSPRLEAWLKQSQTFGPLIAQWREHGAIAPRHKLMAVAMMGAALALSFALDVKPAVLLVQTACLGLAGAFVLTRPSGPR
ncbi:YbaN family protein [uncultured Roseobacter sp.]|uniref:YbaN family protein n=1 Tax=uncultured Roseobacter sp. TaxID=114847 RepID=UPI002623E01F|nr:YbaN family protein [uncultured Roseobacter sp.]